MLDTVYDNTKIKDFLRCNRYYYFRHIRSWRSLGWSAPLIFGSSMHKALEYLNRVAKNQIDNHSAEGKDYNDFLNSKAGEDLLTHSIIAFLQEWNLDPPPEGYLLKARNPDNAAKILSEYVKRYNLFQHKIISIEEPFTISLIDCEYCGRVDLELLMNNLGIIVKDYKTTYILNNSFLSKFQPDRQMEGYTLAGKIRHESDNSDAKFWGAYVTGILVQMNKVDFADVPLKLNNTTLEQWVWETIYYIDQINQELETLLELREANKVNKLSFLSCFPRDPERCWDWNRQCQYNRECLVRNPEHLSDTPGGFVKDKWDPREVNGLGDKED